MKSTTDYQALKKLWLFITGSILITVGTILVGVSINSPFEVAAVFAGILSIIFAFLAISSEGVTMLICYGVSAIFVGVTVVACFFNLNPIKILSIFLFIIGYILTVSGGFLYKKQSVS